ncbi:hypothetical protein MY11210_005794 [Beauveria gryllotalpidicola]
MAALDSKATALAPTTRTVPMKVLCLGMGRTGTVSLRESLQTLGYGEAYHTVSAVTTRFYDCKLWYDLLKKKEAGRKVTREDLDRILGDCQAVLDMPAAYFAEELIEAYPDAKLILTVRDTESWFASMSRTIRPIYESPLTQFVLMMDWLLLMPTRWVHPMFQTLDQVLFQRDFARNGRRVYEEHNARVRALAPPGKLLEYHVREGWAPLCTFLGREVPEDLAAGGTPHLNSSTVFIDRYHGFNYRMLFAQGKRILDVAAYTALMVVVAGAAAKRSGFKWPDFV